MIKIEPVSMANAKEILAFELENRSYFESMLPSRGDDYYVYENFIKIIGEICEDQRLGTLYMNIIRNAENEMVGRVNLFPIELEGHSRAFELGYRIAEKHQGKGYATEAVKQLMHLAFEVFEIDCVQALTAPHNLASQNILIKNDFAFIKRIPNDVEVNGVFEDSVVFERVK